MSLATARGFKALAHDADYYDRAYSIVRARAPKALDDYRECEFLWEPALALVKGRSILDVGCGPGVVAELAQRCGLRYHGFDSSAVAVAMAKARVPGADIVCASAPEAFKAFSGGDYDAVLCTEVLEHVWEDLDLLRAVPVGKQIVASVPNFHTRGHCRWFEDALDVTTRYRGVLTLTALQVTSQGAHSWFIFSGDRR